jgi:hypothetical protein
MAPQVSRGKYSEIKMVFSVSYGGKLKQGVDTGGMF